MVILVSQSRRFLKPLRYAARASARYPSALLLDTGAAPTPLTVLSAFRDVEEQPVAVNADRASASATWTWRTQERIPPLPESRRLSTAA